LIEGGVVVVRGRKKSRRERKRRRKDIRKILVICTRLGTGKEEKKRILAREAKQERGKACLRRRVHCLC
jgi:hypothetical protein